jgi:signal transduction histidine kinase
MIKSLNTNSGDYSASQDLLNDLTRLNSQLDVAVLEIKTLNRIDYDDVTKITSDLRRSVSNLTDGHEDEMYLKNLVESKIAKVESLKSDQAIFRNSLSALPVLIDMLRFEHHLPAIPLESAVFRSVFARTEFDPKPILQALSDFRPESELLNGVQMPELQYLVLHTEKLLEVVPQVNADFALVRELPVEAAIQGVRIRYSDQRERRMMQSRIALVGLFSMIVLLLVVAVRHAVTIWRERAQLEIKVDERTIDLKRANMNLQQEIEERLRIQEDLAQAQKLESLGQLSAGIAHEINTPAQYVGDNIAFLQKSFSELMGVITSKSAESTPTAGTGHPETADAMSSEDVEYLMDEIPKALADSVEGIARVTKIVRALKEFSHPSTEIAPEDLNRAIESTATVARNEWRYVADLTIEADENLQLTPCVLNEFNQVILNIIVNAAHAIADVVGNGGDKGVITIRTRQLKDYAEIQIEDTGGGIPDDVRDRIFDPFFTTKEVGRGTGQGLSIARNIVVNKLGGTITFKSTAGQGTCFTIRLPSENPNFARANVAVV